MKYILRKTKLLLLAALGLVLSAFVLAEKNPVVAEFGKHKIRLDEFKIAYLDLIKKPKIFDSKQLREEFLDEMIVNKLLAEEAKKRGFDKNELLSSKVDSYKKKVMREAHFDKNIKSNITIKESEIEEAYQFLQEERKISHLFAESKEKADSIYSLLMSGESWEKLAGQVFKDSVLSKNGGDLGWVYWDQLDHDISMTAFKLKPGEISKPVKSSYGFHILKMTDYKKKPMITRSEYEIHRRKAKAILQYKIGDLLAAEYINKLAKNAKIELYTEVFQFVMEQLKEKFIRKPSQMNPMSEIQLSDEEIKNVKTSLWDERDRVLAKINGADFTIKDLLGYINYVPYEIIYKSTRATINYAFRDYLITKEAEKLRLDKTEFVKSKSELYKNSLLALEYRKEAIKSVSISEIDIKNYYDKNSSSYNGASFETMKDSLNKLALEEKKRNTASSITHSLLSKYRIKKNSGPIHNYYDTILKTKG